MSDKKLKRSRLRLAITVLALVVLGLGLLLWQASLSDGFWKGILVTIATTLLTIGIVTFVSDFFLKQALVQDVLSLVELKGRLAKSGIDDFAPVGLTDWPAFLGSTSTVECLILEPGSFRSHIWPRLVDYARAHKVAIELAFVDSSIDGLEGLDKRLASGLYLSELNEVAENVEEQWKAVRTSLHSDASLRVRRSTDVPTQGFIRTDLHSAILLPPMLRSTGHDESRALVFRTGGPLIPPAQWLTQSIDMARENRMTASSYSDAVDDSTEPEVRDGS